MRPREAERVSGAVVGQRTACLTGDVSVFGRLPFKSWGAVLVRAPRGATMSCRPTEGTDRLNHNVV